MKSLLSRLMHRRYLRLWLMVAGLVLSLLCYQEVVDDVFQDPGEGDYQARAFDDRVSAFVGAFRTPGLTQVMTDLTALGSVSVILTLFFILASVLTSYRDGKGLAYLAVVLTGAGAWPSLLKPYYGRVRPEEVGRLAMVTDLSFPSGHSFGAAAVYLALAYYVAPYAKNWAHEIFFYCLGAVLILIVGISRIYLGVHYPTDVLAGLFGGIAWGLAASAAFELWQVTRARKR